MTSERTHHPKADVERMYQPTKIGGIGLTQLEMTYKTTTVGLNTSLATTEDALLIPVYQHEANKKLFPIQKEARNYVHELNIPGIAREDQELVISFAKRTKEEAKKWAQKRMTETWEEKTMHGQYPTRV